jgi:phosphopantothenoylcysteine decarboxylase/phosphopantothenate--cysteine ligase
MTDHINDAPPWESLGGKQILLGIGGGIAAYKSAYLCRRLIEAGAQVQVVMTEAGSKFITPLTMESLSGREVITEMFPTGQFVGTRHIDISAWAELVIVAPATANLIGRYAAGLANDMLTTLLIATRAPVLLAPAMNTDMYLHPAVQDNLETLRRRAVLFVEPGVGEMACGTVGVGRMAEPEEIVAAAAAVLAARDKRDLVGHHVIVTAGPTQEPIDPVRVLTNRSSGKMGYAIAEAARMRGATVDLISGPTALPHPSGVELLRVNTSEEMYDAVVERAPRATIIIGVAAVSDWRVDEVADSKLRKEDGTPSLRLVPTRDIMASLGASKRHDQILVGFGLETDPRRLESIDKLRQKGLDLLIANNPTRPGSEFGGDTNEAVLIDATGTITRPGLLSKRALADVVLDRIAEMIEHKRTGARTRT